MGLLNRLGSANPSSPPSPESATATPGGSQATSDSTNARATAGPPETISSDADLKSWVKTRIVANLERRPGAATKSGMRQHIRELFDQIVESQMIELSESALESLFEVIVADLIGLGPLEPFVRDPTVEEVLVIGPQQVYIREGGKFHLTDVQLDNEAQVRLVIDRLVASDGQRVDESNPVWLGSLSDGSRVSVAIPPVSARGSVIAIQRPRTEQLSASDLLGREFLTGEMVALLRACVMAKLNIVVTGPPGAGKTRLLNLLCSFIPAGEFVTMVGRGPTLLGDAPVVALEERPADASGHGEIGATQLLRNALALRPDRIVLAQCTGPEALDMLEAMTRGVRGWLTAVEGASPTQALGWVQHLASSAGTHATPSAIREWIAACVDVVVHVDRGGDGARKVTSISQVAGLDAAGQLALNDAFRFEIPHDGAAAGRFVETGQGSGLIRRLHDAGITLPD